MVQNVKLRLVLGGLTHVLADMLRATMVAPVGTLNGAFIGLFKAWPGFAIDRVRADLTEADYTGAARQAAVWGPAGVDPDQRPSVFAASQVFQPADAVTPNVVIGVALYDANVAGNLLAVGILDNPVELGAATDRLEIAAKVSVPGIAAPDWGIGAALQ